ncbi:MAG: cob(I)yrinic acid a,c-diamide adenosyltransferase [Clostridium sp.]|jgi:cob(I)alamin adenosyltransferase|nr:cob(I)yrinic acid a,c-diamide adenosyltransferase [Clostridium sp.]
MESIVTKTGDQGTTGTLEGERVSKDSSLIELNGTLDELNAYLGVVTSLLKQSAAFTDKEEIIETIEWIQNGLYNMGSEVSSNFTIIRFEAHHSDLLEEKLDAMTEKMPPQTKFILYSGTLEATQVHVARSITRRAERCFVRYLNEIGETPYPDSYQFINRLSDYLFTLARYLNQELKGEEIVTIIWE